MGLPDQYRGNSDDYSVLNLGFEHKIMEVSRGAATP